MTVKDRFLRYISYDTQSDPSSSSYPSTQKQLVLLQALYQEMLAIGLSEVSMDQYGYVMGSIPATKGRENAPVIGFIAHVDTSPDASGKDIRPQIIEKYDGKDIPLGDSVVMKVADFPELRHFVGDTLFTTDGSTLLGADDKAGVAAIMTMAEYLINSPQLAHGKIRIAFTPDEEIGRGVDHFSVDKFGARYAYTVDGGFEGELEWENFNAAGAEIEIMGRNVHPGSAKGKMINALDVAHEIHMQLPKEARPAYTDGYKGFFHLTDLQGEVAHATMSYIIRDHDRTLFEEKKKLLESVVAQVNSHYSEPIAKLAITDQYYNMKEMVAPHSDLITIASRAMELAGVKPIIKPIRGGTDGSRLSFMGLPCPNLFAGGMNFHGIYEYCSLQSMQKAVQTLIYTALLWGQETA